MTIIDRNRLRLLALPLLAVAAVLVVPSPARGASETSVRWDNFSESEGCGLPATIPPYASKSGSLAGTEAILGPYGAYFGRSMSQVRDRLVSWAIPNTPFRVPVHVNALPAFQQVAEGLRQAAAAGLVYPITSVGSFNPRTINSGNRISRHALGLAIDINPARNPYRADGTLITDMPQWFVDVWRGAGFCWGGDWEGAKDPMHLSWMGPVTTPDPSDSLTPLPPETILSDLATPAEVVGTVLAPVLDRYALAVADGNGDGAPDLVGLRSHPDGAVLDISSAAHGYGECSIGRWFVPDPSVTTADVTLLADADGDGRQDLVSLTRAGATMTVRLATRAAAYRDAAVTPTPIDSMAGAVAGADFDGDRRADIWAVSGDGTLRVWGGASWSTLLHEKVLPGGAPALLAVADRDGGNTPEVFALYPTEAGARVDVLRLDSEWTVMQSLFLPVNAGQAVALGAVDYDGDGRADLELVDRGGSLTVYLGNSPTGQPLGRWFKSPETECANPIRLVYNGSFYDDDGSIHEAGIEQVASAGITVGCNPPFKDRFCPDGTLTRAEAAAFIARGLGLPDPGTDFFSDDNGHPLEAEINRIAAAGITVGCFNDNFCPDRPVTRAEQAAFIARGLRLGDPTRDWFRDDDGLSLEDAINRIAEVGITVGCSSAGDQFCPDAYVTRAETATLLSRALFP